MRTRKPYCPVIFIAALLAILMAACQSPFPVTKRSELISLFGVAPLKLLCTGNAIYDLETFTFLDSTLRGKGTVMRNDTSRAFAGEIPLDSVPSRRPEVSLSPMTLRITTRGVGLGGARRSPYSDRCGAARNPGSGSRYRDRGARRSL